MKHYRMTIQWTIHHTDNPYNTSFRTGTSRFECEVKNTEELMNNAIDFCDNLPDWELRANGIDIQEYRKDNTCRYFYRIQLSKVLMIERIK